MSRLGNLRDLSSEELENVSAVLDEKLKKIRQIIADFQLEATTLSYDEFQKRLIDLKADHDRQLKDCCALFEEMSRRKSAVTTDMRVESSYSDRAAHGDLRLSEKKAKKPSGFVVKGEKLKAPSDGKSGKYTEKENRLNGNTKEKIDKMWQDFDLSAYVEELRNTERLEHQELERRRQERLEVAERRKLREPESTSRRPMALPVSVDYDSDSYSSSAEGSVVSDTEFETARSRKRQEQATNGKIGAASDDEGGQLLAGEWRHRLTVPKPFSMTKREEAAGGYRAKTTRSMQRTLADVQAKQEAEQRELDARFRANPPPASIYVPLLARINAREHQRRETVRRNRAEILHELERPFSFTKRDAYRKQLRHVHDERHNTCCVDPETIHRPVFNARPPPTFIYDDVEQRKRDEAAARAYRMQMRAEELLRTSSLPHSMAVRAKNRHLTVGDSATDKKLVSPKCDNDGQAFQPQITKAMPNFNKLHRRFAHELQQRKQSREVTRPQPFSFCAEERSKKRSEKRRDDDSSEEDSAADDRKEKRTHSRTSSLTDKQRKDLKDVTKKEKALRKAYLSELQRLRPESEREREHEREHEHERQVSSRDETSVRRHAWQSYKEALEGASLHGEPTRTRMPRPRAAYSQRDGQSHSQVARAPRRDDGDLDSDDFFSDDGDEKWESLKYL